MQELIDELNLIEDKTLPVGVCLEILGYYHTYEEYGVLKTVWEKKIVRVAWGDKLHVVLGGRG